MEYTAQPPTEPGYYWMKKDGAEEIVEIWVDPAETERHFWVHHCGDGEGCDIGNVTGALWAGPIPRPTS